jgi:hypothetical protein
MSLEGYSVNDAPTLYFNYFLVSGQDTDSLDSFRVFVSDDSSPDTRGEWVLVASNDPADQLLSGVQPLFDNSWEDQPELFPEDPQEPDDAEYILRRNGVRDPYTENRSRLTGQDQGGGGGQPDDDEPPVPSEETSIWRQARVPMGQFAGSSNLRLRFDFSSAGSFGLGDPLTGGMELKARSGGELRDGDQFQIEDVTFEFDAGLTAVMPAGIAIADGETLLVDDGSSTPIAYEFDKNEEFLKRIVVPQGAVVEDGQVFRLVEGDTTTTFEFDADGSAAHLPVAVGDDAAEVAAAIAEAINSAALSFTATAVDNAVELSNAGVVLLADSSPLIDVRVVPISPTAAPVAAAAALASAINAGQENPIVARVVDGSRVQLQGAVRVQQSNGAAVTLEGQQGTTPGTVPVPIDAGMSSADVAAAIANAVGEVFAGGAIETIKVHDHIVRIHGQQVTDAGPLGLADALPGDAGHMFDPARVRENQFQYVVIDDDQGGGGQQPGEDAFDETGNNFVVPYEGVYVDDVIIGFASRGEQVRNHRDNLLALLSLDPELERNERFNQTLQTQREQVDDAFNPLNGVPPTPPPQGGPGGPGQGGNADGIYDGTEVVRAVDRSHFLPERPAFSLDPDFVGSTTGGYQLEIRAASLPTTIDLFVGEQFDPHDRFARAVTLFAPAGFEIYDGQTFTLNNGDEAFVFEYEDLAIGDGVDPDHIAVPYEPTDPDEVVAESIRGAINAPAVRTRLDITASSPSGVNVGPAASERINLFGNVIVGPDAGIAFDVYDGTSSLNRNRPQGQLLIDSNTISHTQMFGIVAEDGFRAFPDYSTIDPLGLLVHAPQTVADYNAETGARRNLGTTNQRGDVTSVVISNNVLARGRAGGVHVSGDSGGFIITPPLAGDAQEGASDSPPTEVWDGGGVRWPFIFAVTDRNGRTVNFEFDSDGQLNNVVPTVPVTFAPNAECPYDDRACMPRFHPDDNVDDMATAIMDAIGSAALDVNVYQSPGDQLFIEGALDVRGIGVGNGPDQVLLYDWFYPWYDQVLPGTRPFARVVNNTIVGIGGPQTDQRVERIPILNPPDGSDPFKEVLINDFTDVGILVDDNAIPTLLNNITVNLEAGIAANNSSRDTIVGAMLFQENVQNARNINVGDFPIALGPNAPLFVDVDNNNFYLAPGARAIDSAVDSIEDRPNLVSLKEPLGLGRSPILSPDRDVLGQLREDDPSVEPPDGFGKNVFKDRGAIDRVDFLGPNVVLLNPRDNDAEGIDKNPTVTNVDLEGVVLSNFTVQFLDSFVIGDPREGTGVDPNSISPEVVLLRQDGRLLEAGIDYRFSFDATNRVIRLTPVAGVWPSGSRYVIEFADGIQDIAGNPLRSNQVTGETRFTITTVIGSDYGDAPSPYPTLLADGGPRHTILPGFHLGNGVTPDEDGQPDENAAADLLDDGIDLPDTIDRGESIVIAALASDAGLLDGWIDFNRDGDWYDAGEQIYVSVSLDAGINELNLTVPEDASPGISFARFRFSSAGGLEVTGPAADGEVEDYRVDIIAGNAWQNTDNPLDVDGDTVVAPVDALLVINEMNNRRVSDPVNGALPLPPDPANGPEQIGYLDVDADRFVSPRDALLVINALNLQAAQRAEGEPDITSLAVPVPVGAAQDRSAAVAIGDAPAAAARAARLPQAAERAFVRLPADLWLGSADPAGIDEALAEFATDVAGPDGDPAAWTDELIPFWDDLTN